MSAMGFPTEDLYDGKKHEKWQYNASTGQWELIPPRKAGTVWDELENGNISRESKVGIGKNPRVNLDLETDANSVGMRMGIDVAPDRDLLISSYPVGPTNGAGWNFNAADTSNGTISFSTANTERMRLAATGAATFTESVTADAFIGDGSQLTNLPSSGIDDAPSDGNFYVRQDGQWVLFNPSSGGGGPALMTLVEQPTMFGAFAMDAVRPGVYILKSAGVGSQFVCTVPDGMKFAFINMKSGPSIKLNTFYVDGTRPWRNAGKDVLTKNDNFMFRDDYHFSNVHFVVENNIKFTPHVGTGDIRILGHFFEA